MKNNNSDNTNNNNNIQRFITVFNTSDDRENVSSSIPGIHLGIFLSRVGRG